MKNFFDCKDEKITEKAFSQSVVISVLSILLCLVVLCSTTYAWFVGETTSNSNTLMSGSFDLIITVTKDDNDYPVIEDETKDGAWICNLTEEGTYIVNLELKEGSTVKGHCLVKVGDDEFKHTAAIVEEHTANSEDVVVTDTFTFTITVTGQTTVTFEPHWGVVVEPDILNEGEYPIREAITEESDTVQEPAA